MNTVFLRRVAGYSYSEYWARCSNCAWSGPVLEFDQWCRKELSIYICRHYWCRDDRDLAALLTSDGWRKL